MGAPAGRGATRVRVLDAALAHFSTKGFDGTAITDIERSAGLSPGSGAFYRHFPSKEAALQAVLEREMERAAIDQRERLHFADEPDPWSALVLDYQRVLEGFEDLAALIDLLVRERDRIGDVVDTIRSVMVEGAVGTDAALVTRLVPPEPGVTPQELATIAFTSLVGLHLTRQFFGAVPFGMSSDRFAEVLATLVLGRRDP